MAQNMLGSLDLTSAWVDIVATYPTAASADVLVQNRGNKNVELVPQDSGAAPAGGATGFLLEPADAMWVNGAHLFVRAWSRSNIAIGKDG